MVAYSRGKTLIVVTNDVKRVDTVIEYVPFKPSQVVCNIFAPEDDCVTVTQHGLVVTLEADLGNTYKIYVAKDSDFEKLVNSMP